MKWSWAISDGGGEAQRGQAVPKHALL